MLKLVLREFSIVVGFAARLDKQITRITLSFLRFWYWTIIHYVLKTNHSFIHYAMLIATNMLGDSARKTNERDKCSGSAGSTRQHPIVSREDLQMFAVLHSLKRHRPIFVCFYPVLDKFGDWNSFGREMALSSRIPVRLAQGAESTSNFRSGTWLFKQPQKYQ